MRLLRILDSSVQDMGERNEPGALESAAGGFVVGIAAGAGNRAESVGFAFEFLDEVGAEAFATVAFVDLHVDVAVGTVVMEKKTAFGDDVAGQFEHEFGAALARLHRVHDFLVRSGAAEDSAVGGKVCGGAIAKNDGFGGEVARISAGEDKKELD